MGEHVINIVERAEEPVVIGNDEIVIDILSAVVVMTETIRPPNVVRSSDASVSVHVKENTDYLYGTLTSLTITGVDDSGLASSIQFTSGGTPTSFSWPALGVEWVNEEIAIEPDSRYMIAFCNKIAYISKVRNIQTS